LSATRPLATNVRLSNLEGPEPSWQGEQVRLARRGCDYVGTPRVRADSLELGAALRDFLIASPRDASHAGVAFGPDGKPIASDIDSAIKNLVLITIGLVRDSKAGAHHP